MMESKVISPGKTSKRSDDVCGGSSKSILSILADKNRVIKILKKQLLNQKLQLGYYLHKNLDAADIREFKKYCNSTFIDENVRVNMAMCKFYKDSGFKSPLRVVFEQMFDIENRLHSVLTQQENMVQIILDKVIKFARNCVMGEEIEKQLSYFLKYFNQFDIFNEILSSTRNLHNELDSLRIYCNRLIIIEDERNALVDQVYSCPLEKLASTNYVLSILGDKYNLKQQLDEMKGELQNFITRIPMYIQKDISIRKILHTESERSTKEMEIVANEEGVTKQLRKLKEENSILNKKLKGMQRLVEKKDEMEAKVVQLEKICTNLVERYTKNKESPKVIQVPSNEMEAKLNKLQEKIRTLKLQALESQLLRKELDYYKTRVETLETCRKTSQETSAETTKELVGKINSQKDVIDLLKKQVQYLLLVIYYMKENKENKSNLNEMNVAISQILSDIDMMVSKNEEMQDVSSKNENKEEKRFLIVNDFENSSLKAQGEQIPSLTVADLEEAELMKDCSEENIPIYWVKGCPQTSSPQNIIACSRKNSKRNESVNEFDADCTTDITRTSIRKFVSKFDSIALNVNKMLNELAADDNE